MLELGIFFTEQALKRLTVFSHVNRWAWVKVNQLKDTVCMCVHGFFWGGSRFIEAIRRVLSFALSIQGHQAPVATLECCVHFWGPHYKRDMDPLKWIHQRVTKIIKALEHRSYGEKLRELGLFSFEKR